MNNGGVYPELRKTCEQSVYFHRCQQVEMFWHPLTLKTSLDWMQHYSLVRIPESKVCILFGNHIKVEWRGRESLLLVWGVHSQWLFMVYGGPCHLLVLVQFVLWSSINAATYREILGDLMLPISDKLYGDTKFQCWFNDHGFLVHDWLANSSNLNLSENL